MIVLRMVIHVNHLKYTRFRGNLNLRFSIIRVGRNHLYSQASLINLLRFRSEEVKFATVSESSMMLVGYNESGPDTNNFNKIDYLR